MVTLDEKQQKMVMIGVGLALLLALLWWWSSSKKKAAGGDKPSSSSGGTKPIIYGSMGCPYTVKQLDKYPDHEFVDCTAGKCPSFVTAYPTTKWPDGRIEVGFS